MKCPHCQHEIDNQIEETEMESEAPEMDMDSDAKVKDDVLAELIEAMRGSLGEKLKPKAEMSVSIIKKKDDEDEEV